MEIPYKTLEGQNARIAALRYSTRRSCERLRIDYVAFNKMSLAEHAPVSSVLDMEASAQKLASSTGNFQPISSKRSKRHIYAKRKAETRQWKAIQAEEERIEKKLSVLRASHLEALDDDDDNGGVPLRPSITDPKTTAKKSVGAGKAKLTAPYNGQVAGEATKPQRHTRSRIKRKRLAVLWDNPVGLNPSAPPIEPLPTAPLGAACVPPHEQSKVQNPSMTYPPLQSVHVLCVTHPWRIDKLYRYVSTSTLRNTYKAPMPAPLVPMERWPSSPPRSAPFSTTSVFQRDSKDRLSKETKSHISTSLAPEPTANYLAQSSRPTQKLLLPQTLLIVLDLNGTLLYRTKSRVIYPRPNLAKFLKYCLTNHCVCIWSSARPLNVELMCSTIFEPYQRALLLAEWGRDTFGLSKVDYDEKVQVYKRLDVLWSKPSLQRNHPHNQSGGRWSQANTVLIDDNMLKAVAQPYNHIEIPEYTSKLRVNSAKEGEDVVLGQVVAYLEEARMWKDVSSFMRHEKFMIKGGWDWDWAKGRRLTPDSREHA